MIFFFSLFSKLAMFLPDAATSRIASASTVDDIVSLTRVSQDLLISFAPILAEMEAGLLAVAPTPRQTYLLAGHTAKFRAKFRAVLEDIEAGWLASPFWHLHI